MAKHLLRLLLIVLLAAVLTVVLADRLHGWPGPPEHRIDEKTTISLLRSEALAFLVTRRLTTQIVVEHAESAWHSDWRGVLWATVQIHYGVDLQKIDEDDIRRDGDVLVVTLPEPQLLDFAIEPGSVGFLSKSTAVAKVEDLWHDGQRHLLEQQLRDQALAFARQHDQMPTRRQIADQLNAASAWLKATGGVALRFE